MRCALCVLFAAWLAFALGNAQAEPAVTTKAVDLKQNPAADAKSVAQVPAETAVDLVKREGAWVQLKAGKNTGWAKLFDVRLGQPGQQTTKGGGGAGASQLLNLAAGSRTSTGTTGVRGLDKDMLKKAVPDPAQVAVLDRYAVQKPEAESFARQGRLVVRTVDPLPTPSKGGAK
jgi:hypothetical protein